MVSRDGPSHRERLRALTVAEIKQQGYAQIASAGPAALSLNGIAKSMGMTGPAMYRYFPSREALLVTLVTESYEDLADTLVGTAVNARRRVPEARLRAVANASRDWALAAPHRYRLVFGSSYGSGVLDPTGIVPTANRAMAVILSALADLPGGTPPPVSDPTLRGQLVHWGTHQEPTTTHDPGDLLLGLTAWTRLLGIVSLEIEGFFNQLGVEPARLYASEIDHLIDQRQQRPTRQPRTAEAAPTGRSTRSRR